jgi:hypothetical protein
MEDSKSAPSSWVVLSQQFKPVLQVNLSEAAIVSWWLHFNFHTCLMGWPVCEYPVIQNELLLPDVPSAVFTPLTDVSLSSSLPRIGWHD